MILVALVIVAIVAKEALKGYGLAPALRRRRAGTPPSGRGCRARSRGSGRLGRRPSAASALERARGVEEMVKQQAAERAARGDGTAQ
jgi:hypothetical protein